MTSPLERRVEKLETAAGANSEYYSTLIIWDPGEAQVCRNWSDDYRRQQADDESEAQFMRRVEGEAAAQGVKPLCLTRKRYLEIAAELDEKI